MVVPLIDSSRRYYYERPSSLDEAIALLDKHKTGRVLAGGTDLFTAIKRGKTPMPDSFIDLWDLRELREIGEKKGRISIGSMVTASQIIESKRLKDECTALHTAACLMAGPQIRNRATIGGNVANASPAADLAIALLGLGASVWIAGPDGSREVSLDNFFTGLGKTCLKRSELIVEFLVPKGITSSFCKLRKRNAMTIAVVSAAACLKVGSDGLINDARISLGAVAPTPVRARACEKHLIGKRLDDIIASEDSLRAAGALAAENCCPITDVRASSGYRKAVVSSVVMTALEGLSSSSSTSTEKQEVN